MKFSSFALAAVAIAASSVNAFSTPNTLGRVVAQVCYQYVGKYCGKKIGDTKVIFYLLYHMCGIVHGRLFGQNNKCLDHGHRR